MAEAAAITVLLARARDGDADAKNELFPAVYRDLEAIARAHVRAGESIEPRALVHEMYLRLSETQLDARDRKHFFAIAALAMRQILVDRARRRKAAKRGGDGGERVTLEGLASEAAEVDVMAIDRELDADAGHHIRLTDLFGEAMDLSRAAQRALIARIEAEEDAERGRAAALLDADTAAVTGLSSGVLQPPPLGTAPPHRPSLPPEEIAIPNYRIDRVLGEGGMGVVYYGEQIEPPRRVAIKVLQFFSSQARSRFRAEAAIMGELDHSGIARVLASGEANDHLYIVMEYVDGTTLDAYVRAHAPSLRERLELMASICDAVHYAHESGVIHRDLKPANVMVRADGRIAVLDFGVARAAGSPGTTATGDFLGTPLYASPEQAMMGSPDSIDARSDVYSLGVTLFELVAGALPYALASLTLPEVTRAILREEPRALGHDPALDAIAARALAKRPADRFASAAELAGELRRYLGGLG